MTLPVFPSLFPSPPASDRRLLHRPSSNHSPNDPSRSSFSSSSQTFFTLASHSRSNNLHFVSRSRGGRIRHHNSLSNTTCTYARTHRTHCTLVRSGQSRPRGLSITLSYPNSPPRLMLHRHRLSHIHTSTSLLLTTENKKLCRPRLPPTYYSSFLSSLVSLSPFHSPNPPNWTCRVLRLTFHCSPHISFSFALLGFRFLASGFSLPTSSSYISFPFLFLHRYCVT